MATEDFENSNSFDSMEEEESDTSYEDKTTLKISSKKYKNPVKYEIERPKIMELEKAIANILSDILETNKQKKNTPKKKDSAFYSAAVPKISLYDYIKRIQKYTFIENNTMILSLIYIDRICLIDNFELDYCNIHKVIFAAILIAIKFNEDKVYSNNYFSKVAGVSLKELNLMEKEILTLLEFKLYVDDTIFKQYEKYLQSFCENE